jgi:hypothetical protein
MRKFLTAAVAALTLGGAMVATTAPAEARPYGWHGGGYHGYHYYRHGGNPGVAVAAGIAGLAVGAALASGNRGYSSYYYGPSYSYGYYGPRPYYGRSYYRPYYARPHYRSYARTCFQWRYDRWGRAYQVRGWC